MKSNLILNNSEQKVKSFTMHDTYSPPELTASLLWLMTISTGIVVGNNYYNQPLLGLMAKDFFLYQNLKLA